jgi:hypothetical protein
MNECEWNLEFNIVELHLNCEMINLFVCGVAWTGGTVGDTNGTGTNCGVVDVTSTSFNEHTIYSIIAVVKSRLQRE